MCAAAYSSALARTFSAALCVAEAVITVAREACAPMPKRDAVGLAVHHAHALVVDAERFGSDLRHHRLEPLPDRGAAGDDFDKA